jgi:isovaleryl-CoA dehydrogenase
MGLLGITCPEKYGGTGLGYLEHSLCTEELSRASGSIGLSYIAHSNLCVNQIVLNGSEEQKEKYLPKLCSGEYIGALAMSEVGAGSDVMSMRLKADKVDGGYVLNGSKFWITNGPDAGVLVVYATVDHKLGHKGITAFIVENKFKGFSVGKKIDKIGMRGSSTGELIFDNCFVPEENVMGGVGNGAHVLMKGLNFERLILAAGPIGLMQAAIDVVLPYIRERKQFGKTLIEFGSIQSRIAELQTSTDASRCYVYANAIAADKGKSKNMECASAFLFTSELATKQASEAILCLGGAGYTNDFPLGRIWRDAKLYEIGGGTTDIRKLIIARELAKN